ncbi:transcriptional repressor TCF25-domain-containing protein [Gloeopeniophorella convolvens]|nr:transcriptional repressor TCF25-domain-containing protein [Gloeopeniophorella convolvens]
MPARLSKRQQRELEELTHAGELAQTKDSSEDEEEISSVAATRSAFAALLNNDNESSDEGSASEKPAGSSKAKRSKKKKKKKASAPTAHIPSAEPASPLAEPAPVASAPDSGRATPSAPPTPSQNAASKREWKALKKQKAKAKKDDKDDFDRALDELSTKYSDIKIAGSSASSGKVVSSRSVQEEYHKLLSVSLSHLNPDAEMRRFFGAKVISASQAAPGSSSGARRQPTNQRSNLTRPKPTWWPAKLREGLTLRPLTDLEVSEKAEFGIWDDDEERYWTIEYSKRYKGATLAFMQTVLSGDPEGFYAILQRVPWHADTILQLAELYSHREEHSQAADFIERALFTYERTFVGAFTFTNGLNRLDFDRVENRPFFLALHRQVIDLQRRGIYRTAFEYARLLLSLDPWSDPHGAYLHLDFLAVKTGMHTWLLSFYDLFATKAPSSSAEKSRSDRAPVNALPGWAYARALALRAEDGDRESQSTAALKQAVLEFPSVVPLLADKAEIALSADVRSKPAFRIYTRHDTSSEEEAVLHLLSHLYVQRSHTLWKDPSRASWFAEVVTNLVQTGKLPSKPTATAGFGRLRDLASRGEGEFKKSVYRHVVVLGAPAQSLLSYIPASVTTSNSLACDPLPPPRAQSLYNDNFFKGAEDAFATSIRRPRNARQTQRLLERLIPDPVLRRQLQGFVDAHPRLVQQFPGGVVQFAQLAVNMPEEALQDLMINAEMVEEVMAQRALPHGEMPGGLPGDNFVQLDFPEQEDIDVDGPEEAHAPQEELGDEPPPLEEEDDDNEDDDDDEVAPLPVRVLRNLIGRFWGGATVEEEDISDHDDESHDGADTDGVD